MKFMQRLMFALLPLATPTIASGFTYSRSVTVDHTQCGASNSSNFPLLFNFTDVTFKSVANGGHVQSGSGYDFRPFSDSGLTSALTYQLERYNASTGEVVMWIKIPTLSSSADTVFYVAYGDATITTDDSSGGVWDSNYKGVWHLKDGTTLSLTDASGSGNTLTNTASVGATTGQIDGGAGSFDGTSQALNTPSIDLTAVKTCTVSAWIDWTSFANDDDLMFEFSTNYNFNQGVFIVNPNSSTSSAFDVISKAANGRNGGHFTRPASGMRYYVFTVDLGTGTALAVKAYVNGTSQSITQDTSFDNSAEFLGNFSLYIMSRAATSLFAAGKVDEVRLSNIVRGADWITAEYNNQKTSSTMLTLGSEGGGGFASFIQGAGSTTTSGTGTTVISP